MAEIETQAAENETPMTDAQVYKEYMKNVRASEELQCEIMVGAREGEDVCVLLMKACRAISNMTGSSVFADQVERSLRAVYGEALGVEHPLEQQIQEAKERLEKIQQAEMETEEGDLREAMHNSARSHELRIKRLQKKLDDTLKKEQKKANPFG